MNTKLLLSGLAVASATAACVSLGVLNDGPLPAAELDPVPAKIVDAEFLNPPRGYYPNAWWHWMNGDITEEGIVADLAAMAEAGLAGVTVFDGGQKGPADYLTPQWKKCFARAGAEAKKNGMRLWAANCGGWSSSGGPWITPELSMKRLVASETAFAGPATFDAELPMPRFDSFIGNNQTNFYRDVAVMAVPDWTLPLKHVQLEKDPASTNVVTVDFGQPTDFCALWVKCKKSGELNFHLQVSDDGKVFRKVGERWYRNRRSRDDTNQYRAFYFGPQKARYARIHWPSQWQKFFDTAASFYYSNHPVVEDADDRAAGNSGEFDMMNFPQVAAVKTPAAAVATVDLTSSFDAKTGRLKWTAPAGRWRILRMGYTSTGKRQVSSVDSGTGLECDKLSEKAIDCHLDNIVPQLKDALAATGGRLDGLLIDSNEVCGQNWTEDILEEFKARKGYDARPYLPAMFGADVGGVRTAERFLSDWRNLVSTLYGERYYKRFADRCRALGLKSTVEPYDGPFECFDAGRWCDVPKGETWLGGDGLTGPRMKLVSSIGNLYGQRVIASESFTSFGFGEAAWRESVVQIRRIADGQFAGGVNKTVLHSVIHQPFVREDAKPGFALFCFGTHFGRNQTWWPMARDLFRYIARSQYLLRAGHAVNDFLVYQGDEMPNGFQKDGAERNDFHTDVFKSHGFDFDLVDAPTILDPKRLSVADGRLRVAGGLDYSALIIPTNRICNLATVRALKRLVEAGATVVAGRPEGQATLVGYPESDADFAALVKELWGETATPAGEKALGKGRLIWGVAYGDVGDKLGLTRNLDVVPQDPKATKGRHPINMWNHRAGDGWDSYFVVAPKYGSCEKTWKEEYVVRFRVKGRLPEIFDAVDGSIVPAKDWRETADGTEVKLTLWNNTALFVVFRKPASENGHSCPFTTSPSENGHSCPFTSPSERTGVSVLRPFTSPWKLEFLSERGAPASLTYDTIVPLSDSDNEAVKYYSGLVRYSTTFDFAGTEAGKRYEFSLGEIGAGAVPRAYLNGTRLTRIWTLPNRQDVTALLKKGKNELVIELATPWSNRLVGDNNNLYAGGKKEYQELQQKDLKAFREGKPRVSKGWTWLDAWHVFLHEKKMDLTSPNGLIANPTIEVSNDR